ncbi:hypothetical protein BJ165DRAFT_1531988 [Panaeolus papilionaceus]|nr:hypothetical protein BJ165DRAFT_1531988 [Panaeolus papilionaceus]
MYKFTIISLIFASLLVGSFANPQPTAAPQEESPCNTDRNHHWDPRADVVMDSQATIVQSLTQATHASAKTQELRVKTAQCCLLVPPSRVQHC